MQQTHDAIVLSAIKKAVNQTIPLNEDRIRFLWKKLVRANPPLALFTLRIEKSFGRINPATVNPYVKSTIHFMIDSEVTISLSDNGRYWMNSRLYPADVFLSIQDDMTSLDLVWAANSITWNITDDSEGFDFDVIVGNFAIQAIQAGAWYLVIHDHEFIILPFPSTMEVDDRNRLHSLTGPALTFLDWSYYFIHGVQVSEQLVMRPEKITPKMIMNQFNVEVKRVMLDLYGLERFMIKSKAELVVLERFASRDYALYHLEMPGDESLTMIKVTNATAEPDGTFKDYWIRVPPWMQTAIEAVAWTFSLTERDYRKLGFES